MRNAFITCKSLSTAKQRCPWAEIIVKEEGGFRCFFRDAPQTESSHRYSPVAVQREIDKDKRIKPAEAKLIHALLRGRD